ncbi:CBS domain-containing protein [Citromicrobium bathyomarinum]|uniref:CBS domain-containing protein n=1 Tax=Citromicrobium bathyomarinum TaxID=72174 RepID=UPI00315AF08B
MTIERLMADREAGDILSCTTQTIMRDAVALLAEKRIGALPVMDGDRVVGIFSERDVIYCMAREDGACLDRPVGEVMTTPPITVSRGEQVDRALALMTKRRIRHLPVVENEELIGFISIGDLVKYRFDKVEQEAQEMRSYIQTA